MTKQGVEIVTDPDTGGQKERCLARFDLIPTKPMWLLAEHYGRGSRKYSDRNWERGYNWSLSYDSLCHHLNQFWSGEDYDTESDDYDPDKGENNPLHLVAVMWHAAALIEFFHTHPEKDNRPKKPNATVKD